jgi:hypothetical protein
VASPTAAPWGSPKTGPLFDPTLPAPPEQWPRLGTRVQLAIGADRTARRAQVVRHDLARGVIEVTPPAGPTGVLAAGYGAVVTVTWSEDSGLLAMRTRLVELPERRGIWGLEPTSPRALIDRRRHPRVPWHRSARLRTGEGTEHEVTIVDVSMGGVRAVADPGVALAPGSEVETTFSLEHAPFVATGQVAWREQRGERVELGIAFRGLERAETGRLRRLIRALMLRGTSEQGTA